MIQAGYMYRRGHKTPRDKIQQEGFFVYVCVCARALFYSYGAHVRVLYYLCEIHFYTNGFSLFDK